MTPGRLSSIVFQIARAVRVSSVSVSWYERVMPTASCFFLTTRAAFRKVSAGSPLRASPNGSSARAAEAAGRQRHTASASARLISNLRR